MLHDGMTFKRLNVAVGTLAGIGPIMSRQGAQKIAFPADYRQDAVIIPLRGRFY